MTDTVVGTDERFRRRHNPEGHMEYWLEAEHLLELRKTAGLDPTSPMLVPLNPAMWPNHLQVGGAAAQQNTK
jgi:hypothetical protein